MTFTLQKTQILPYKKLGTLVIDTYEKALRIGEQWINSVKDSYDPIRHTRSGPDFFYTITENV